MPNNTDSSHSIPNRILTGDARTSRNFWSSDRILQHYLHKHLDKHAIDYMEPKLLRLGGEAATVLDELSLRADRHSPELVKRTPMGEAYDEVRFHPQYHEMAEIAVKSEMIWLKYESSLRARIEGMRHRMGFAAGQLFAMSEIGFYCPLCMTDGAAYVLERHAPEEIRRRLIPRLSSRNVHDLYTGAMFLTEKSGGSDVGRNQTTATPVHGRVYRLNGEKWFCSNVNADVMLVLARTDPEREGTRGLSLFLVEKTLNGEPWPADTPRKNPMKIVRLKEKLGVRSMATGEVLLTDTLGFRIGEEGEGFKIMADMINMSRIYNSLTAVAALRRALIEAWQYTSHRIIFGKRAVEHPLMREKFHELGTTHLSNFLLVWRAIEALDRMETGAEEEAQRFRILTPLAKWSSAEAAVYGVRECMELMDGNGYIEDFILPKLFRDVNVLPIWEGAGNVIVLDILRAWEKTDGLDLLLEEMQATFEDHPNPQYQAVLEKETAKIKALLCELPDKNRDVVEATSKPLFTRLTFLYQVHLMLRERDETSREWLDPALQWMLNSFGESLRLREPLPVSQVEKLIGWKY